jgi:hypothetical protein
VVLLATFAIGWGVAAVRSWRVYVALGLDHERLSVLLDAAGLLGAIAGLAVWAVRRRSDPGSAAAWVVPFALWYATSVGLLIVAASLIALIVTGF